MDMLDANELAEKLQTRFGLGISGSVEEIDGGRFSVLRPIDLEYPNGFGIVLARTPRLIEASFKADTFTRGLLRHMAESDEEARTAFTTLAHQAIKDGFRLTISINGNHVVSLNELPHGDWDKLELDCDKRMSVSKPSLDQYQNIALETASVCLGLILVLLPVEEVAETIQGFDIGLPEGAQVQIIANKYERSPANRAACISHYGALCQVCSFHFGSFYGPIGQDFIEVHHKVPVSLMGGQYRVDPVKDLVPVCGNCHAMMHRKNPPFSVDELKALLSNPRDDAEN
jgi:5-methylcytosine-specific restriction protein A